MALTDAKVELSAEQTPKPNFVQKFSRVPDDRESLCRKLGTEGYTHVLILKTNEESADSEEEYRVTFTAAFFKGEPPELATLQSGNADSEILSLEHRKFRAAMPGCERGFFTGLLTSEECSEWMFYHQSEVARVETISNLLKK